MIGYLSFVIGHLSLVICHWSLVICHWSFVFGGKIITLRWGRV
ncbi:hypothetical protein [Coleofasciculus sp. F4-SAH-05]